MIKTFYDYSHPLLNGTKTDFLRFKGSVVLVVNTASKCGFTPQYKELEELYEKYKNQDFIILGFPADDYLHQEPGSNEEIAQFCQLNFGVTFPMFQKSHVRGKEINELFAWLTSQEGNKGPVMWNFEKFLINKEGEVTNRFRSSVKPLSKPVIKAIESSLTVSQVL